MTQSLWLRTPSGIEYMPNNACMRSLAVFLAVFATTGAHADDAPFFAGKTINLEIGYSPGGGYDTYARLVAQHLGKHIPGNPTVIAKNRAGAGSLRLANWLYNVAAKDGTEIGTVGRGVPFDPLMGSKGAQFKADRFTWLGSANNEVSVCGAWKSSGIASFQDLLTKPMSVGGTGGGSDTDAFPEVINSVLNTKMNVISGFTGGNDVAKAMETGEVQGRCGWSWSSIQATHKDWLEQKKIVLLTQLSTRKHPDLADVPLVTEFAKTDEQRQILELVFARQVIGRPFLAPPDLPPGRAEILQAAFMQMMNDPEFMAEARKASLEITPVSGPDVAALLTKIYRTPAPIVAKAAKALGIR